MSRWVTKQRKPFCSQSHTLSRRAKLACTGFKEAEFSQGYELGTISVFRDPRVNEKSYSVMVSGKFVSTKTQLEMIKISPVFGFMLGQERSRVLATK